MIEGSVETIEVLVAAVEGTGLKQIREVVGGWGFGITQESTLRRKHTEEFLQALQVGRVGVIQGAIICVAFSQW